MSDATVQHDRANRKFTLLAEGQTAVAEYEMDGTNMIFTHTWVPDELRGRGIAAKLIQTALEFARDEKKIVIPQCSYVEVFLKRHPEFQNLTASRAV